MRITHGFHATMTALPGKADEALAALLDAPSLPNDDCVVFLVGRSASDPAVLHVTEGWVSEEAHGRFFASDEAKAFTARLQLLLTADSQYSDEVPVGGKPSF
ncbi:putative quinol monooxygenase [Kribbella sp. CA-293567]|uniref:putative quinol monooxygenase n=1 Tax=Kribbella sp. CA-293567 TaxID=3002436 RepID=UPI0022DE2057|nr:antibiotic biosynthesis monooxygenase [Kribbella sp. CA-293567]WBQ07636.1 antibiotic biosynthesis monooxygenase [Kribbella sp. CA-293567]